MIDVLALDIDGVLNSHGSAIYWNRHGKDNGGFSRHNDSERAWCPIACSNLLFLLEERPNIRIVVSSTWRLGETTESMAQTLWECAKVPKDKVIGLTPYNLGDVERGIEIQAWMDEFGRDKIRRLVILDDDSDMAHLKNYLVKTSVLDGLTQSKTFEVIDRFDFPWKSTAPVTMHDKIQWHIETYGSIQIETVYDEADELTTTYWSDKDDNLICKLVTSPKGGRRGYIHRCMLRVNAPDMKTK